MEHNGENIKLNQSRGHLLHVQPLTATSAVGQIAVLRNLNSICNQRTIDVRRHWKILRFSYLSQHISFTSRIPSNAKHRRIDNPHTKLLSFTVVHTLALS